ncbi:MAG TPA: hypothetical protein VE641_17240 [Chthoniobacterales bacterium]|nr:hypothetical protein [Chthoniobacterales bacterium]
MTRLTIAEAPEQEFSVRGRNAATDADDEGLIFYDDVTRVHVLPDELRFTIQVVTPDLEVDMDLPDADSVRDALEHFEAKKVTEVSSAAPGSVRIVPLEPEPRSEDSGSGLVEPAAVDPLAPATPSDVLIAPDPHNVLEQIPSRPDERPRENLPDIQRREKPLA